MQRIRGCPGLFWLHDLCDPERPFVHEPFSFQARASRWAGASNGQALLVVRDCSPNANGDADAPFRACQVLEERARRIVYANFQERVIALARLWQWAESWSATGIVEGEILGVHVSRLLLCAYLLPVVNLASPQGEAFVSLGPDGSAVIRSDHTDWVLNINALERPLRNGSELFD